MDARRRRGPHNGEVYDWRGALARLRPPWPDLVLALAFTAALGALIASRTDSSAHATPLQLPRSGLRLEKPPGPDGPDWGDLAGAGLFITLPLALRRRAPLAVFAVQIAGAFAIRGGGWVAFIACLVGAYSLARHGRWPWLSFGALLVVAALVGTFFTQPVPEMPGWSAPFVILVPIGLFGVTIRSARARADASAQRAALLEREQAAIALAAAARERARIAGELHDVVSHHVSVMTIQAGAAGKVLDTRPDLARAAVRAIEASGREAMGELRHLLGVLAAETDQPVPLRPQPGLDQLDALVASVCAAGQPVTAHRVPVPLPPALDRAAYRVVQEALTNALRYAPGARTEVTVAPDGDALVVEVTDDGPGTAPAGTGTGSGLAGLAERLRLSGGTLTAGRRLTGGFRVYARLPLEHDD